MKKRIFIISSVLTILGSIYLWTILKSIDILDGIENMFDFDEEEELEDF